MSDSPKSDFFKEASIKRKYVEKPNIYTSYHLYEIVLFVSERFGGNWINSIDSAINKQRNLIADYIEKRCENTANFFNQTWIETNAGMGCLINPDDEKYWGFPYVHYKCAQDLRIENNNFFAICFGKFDVLGIQPVPHSYWSSLLSSFLTCKEDFFSETISIPTLRIKYEAEIVNEHEIMKNRIFPCVDEKTKVSLELPFVIVTFLRFRKDLFHQKCNYMSKDCPEQEKNTKRKCSRIYNLERFLWEFGTSMSKNFKKNRIELFLTFSMHYPTIIKAEFENFKEIEKYLGFIRNKKDLFLETSSIFGVNQSSLVKGKEFIHKVGKEEKPIRFVLLCKVDLQKSTDEEMCKEIIDILLRNRIISKKDIEEKSVLTYHSGYYWDVRIAFSTHKVGALLKAITREIKCLPSVKKSIIYPSWELSYENLSPDSNSSESDVFQCPNIIERERFWNWNKKDILKGWEKIYNHFPNFPSGEKSLDNDIFNSRFYDLIFNLGWLVGYLAQLEQSWFLSKAPHIETFLRLKEAVSSLIKEVDYLMSNLDLLGFYNVFGCNTEGKFYQRQEKEFFKPLFENLWRRLLRNEEIMTTVKFIISSLMVEFNERNEGREIVTVSDPYIRFAERAGLTDLACGAVNSLFYSYCGFPEEEELTRLKWNGLVSISSGHDFEISPRFQTLFLPADFLCHIYHKLPLLAHEAGHFILSNLPRNSNAFESFVSSIWEETYDKALDELKKTLELLGDVKELERTFNIVRSDLHRQRDKPKFTESEIFIDIFAGLVAGPMFFHSLVKRGFRPSIFHTRDWRHSEIMLRVLIGIKMGIYLNWNNDLWELNSLWESIGAHNLLIQDQIDFIEKDNVDWFRSLDSLKIREEKSFLFDPTTYLAKVVIRDPSIVKVYQEWISEHLHNLFFQDYLDNPENIYNECKDIAKRICWGSEIVRDKPLKFVSAASVIEPLCRPYYPSGRILLSLFYGDI